MSNLGLSRRTGSTNVPDVDEYTIAAMEMSAQNARQRDAGHMADAMARWMASNAVCARS